MNYGILFSGGASESVISRNYAESFFLVCLPVIFDKFRSKCQQYITRIMLTYNFLKTNTVSLMTVVGTPPGNRDFFLRQVRSHMNNGLHIW